MGMKPFGPKAVLPKNYANFYALATYYQLATKLCMLVS